MAYYRPGESGNPAGRPPGVGRVTELKRLLLSRSEELIGVLIDKALSGDMLALRMAVDRLVPVLRPVDTPVCVPRPDSGDTADQSRYVIDALLSGGLPANTAVQITQALVMHQTMGELKELERRIALLEKDDNEHD